MHELHFHTAVRLQCSYVARVPPIIVPNSHPVTQLWLCDISCRSFHFQWLQQTLNVSAWFSVPLTCLRFSWQKLAVLPSSSASVVSSRIPPEAPFLLFEADFFPPVCAFPSSSFHSVLQASKYCLAPFPLWKPANSETFLWMF